MKEKKLFSDCAITKSTEDMLKNTKFLKWLNRTLCIMQLDGMWIIHDGRSKPEDWTTGKTYIQYEMTEEMIQWFYDSYLSSEYDARESRGFVSLDAFFEDSDVIITEETEPKYRELDNTIRSILKAQDVMSRTSHTIRYPTGNLEKEIQRKERERLVQFRLRYFPYDRYEEILDKTDVICLAGWMVQLPGALYAKMLNLSLDDMKILAPLFIYDPVNPDGTKKKGAEKVNESAIAKFYNVSRAAVTKRLNKIYKTLFGRDRSEDKKARKAIMNHRDNMAKEAEALVALLMEERIAMIEKILEGCRR